MHTLFAFIHKAFFSTVCQEISVSYTMTGVSDDAGFHNQKELLEGFFPLCFFHSCFIFIISLFFVRMGSLQVQMSEKCHVVFWLCAEVKVGELNLFDRQFMLASCYANIIYIICTILI